MAASFVIGCGQTIPASPCTRDKGSFWAGPIACYADKEGLESARYGDWLIQTDDLRVVLRAGASALTQTNPAGGGIVDIAGTVSADLIYEMLPVTTENNWRETSFSATENGVVIKGTANGSLEETTLSIEGDSIVFTPPVDWRLTPKPDSQFFIDTLTHGDSALVIQAEDVDDLNGQLHLKGLKALKTSTLENRYDGEMISILAEGQWLVFGDDEGAIGRLPIINGHVEGRISTNATQWRIEALPCQAGEWKGLSEQPDLGNCTKMILKGIDQDGSGLPFSVHDGESRQIIPIGGGQIQFKTETQTLIANAGPGYEQRTFSPTSDMRTLEFQRAVPNRLLLIADSWAHPDIDTRQSPQTAAESATAMGGQIILLRSRGGAMQNGVDLDEKWGFNSQVWQGAQDKSSGQWTTAWPWTGNATKNPLMDLDPIKSLLHAKGERRISMVSAEWMENAPPPHLLPTIPDLMWIDGATEIDSYIHALEAGMSTGPLGPRNWLLGVEWTENSSAEKMAALYDQNLCAGNGPFINLTIDDVGPGGLIRSNGDEFNAVIKVAAPHYMGLRSVEIIGPEGEISAHYEIQGSSESHSLVLPRAAWYIAKASGGATPFGSDENAWAITAPIWITEED